MLSYNTVAIDESSLFDSIDHSLGAVLIGIDRVRRLDDSVQIAGQPPIDLLRLEEALHELESIDARKVRVVELLFFVGLTVKTHR